MKINRRLFRKVKQAILAKPREFEMEDFGRIIDVDTCRTACCIGGHALVHSGYTTRVAASDGFFGPAIEFVGPSCRPARNVFNAAKRTLGLTEIQATVLFHARRWPVWFYHRWTAAKTPYGRARVAADVIDAFLANPQQFVKDGRAWW